MVHIHHTCTTELHVHIDKFIITETAHHKIFSKSVND